MSVPLGVVFLLASSVWLGGLVAIAVVARVATRTLTAADRVAFFRGLGRGYGIVSGIALVVALATGAALLAGRAWDATLVATVVAAAALVLTTVLGVVQARRMTRLRRRALSEPADTALSGQVSRRARAAAALRGLIALFSLALLVLGVLLAS